MNRAATPPSRRNPPQSSARSERSQNSQKSGQDRRSPFTDHIRRRERELQRQIDALLAERANFDPVRAALAEENARLDSRERELENIEAEFAEQEERMRKITTCHRSKTEIEQQTTVLYKAASDLQQQLVIAQSELDSAKLKVVTMMGAVGGESPPPGASDEHARELSNLEQAVRRKTAQVARLKQLIDSLQEDVISRENEVIKVELQAVAHQKTVEAMRQKRADLEQRYAAAEAKRKSLLAAVAERDADRQAVLEELARIRDGRRAPDQEAQELNVIEAPVLALEKQLREIEGRIRSRDAVISEERERQRRVREEQLAFERAQAAFVDGTVADVTAWLTFYQAREAEIEARMDVLEAVSGQIRERCDDARCLKERYWAAKLQATKAFIDRVAPAAAADPSNEQLEQRLRALGAEAAALEGEIGGAEAEIRDAADPAHRAALAAAEAAARATRDRLAAELAVLEDADVQLECEAADLEVQESDLRLQMDIQKEAARALAIRERTARRLIDGYARDLADAERRCEALAGR
jgi:DNA repair exonuclease SbcCD ATPase subunit